MEILLVATELSPWVQSTDSADEVSALARTFRQLGHDVTILVPFAADYEQGGLLVARRLTPLTLRDGRSITVYDAQLSSGSKIVLAGLPAGADKPLLTSEDPDAAALHAANAFALAVVAFVGQRAEQAQPFDVVHLFDWTTALAGLGLRNYVSAGAPKIVLSVHDAKKTGSVEGAQAAATESELLRHEVLSHRGQLVLLKAGLLTADAIIVPSDGHADAWSTGDGERGLGNAFAEVRSTIAAVSGGVDYAKVNPATNPTLTARFDAEDASAKQVTKTAVLRELGLPLDPRPFVLVPGPLTMDAGADLVLGAIESLAERDLSICIWSQPTDPPELIAELERQIQGHGARIAHRVLTAEDAMHRGFAAADFALFPCRHTLGQVRYLAAQRYGAIVVAMSSPGLRDAIVDCDVAFETGTGFVFEEATCQALIGAITRAQAAYYHPGFSKLRRRVMRQDCGWERPSRRLLQIYKRAVSGKSRDATLEAVL